MPFATGVQPPTLSSPQSQGQLDPQIIQQLQALIMELFRRAQGQGGIQQQTQQQALPPDATSASGLLGPNFPRALPSQRTQPLGGLGNRQGLFTQTVQAPSGRDQTAAAIGSLLKNVISSRKQKQQGLV